MRRTATQESTKNRQVRMANRISYHVNWLFRFVEGAATMPIPFSPNIGEERGVRTLTLRSDSDLLSI
jgi:hypothetical protein